VRLIRRLNYKVLVRPGQDLNPRPTSTEADALATRPLSIWCIKNDKVRQTDFNKIVDNFVMKARTKPF